MKRYKDGFAAGEKSVLQALGIRKEQYEDLLKLKSGGSAVIISFTSHELPTPEFVDQEFSSAPLGEALVEKSGALWDSTGKSLEGGVNSPGYIEKALDLVNRIEDKTND